MDLSEIALKYFKSGYVCSQAVLVAYADRYGIDKKTALKIATAFGGGIARTAEICGAVSGGLMVIGLAHGRADLENQTDKEQTYALSRELMQRIQTKFGSTICKHILGEDISTEQGRQAALDKKLFETTCCDCIRFTVDCLEQIV